MLSTCSRTFTPESSTIVYTQHVLYRDEPGRLVFVTTPNVILHPNKYLQNPSYMYKYWKQTANSEGVWVCALPSITHTGPGSLCIDPAGCSLSHTDCLSGTIDCVSWRRPAEGERQGCESCPPLSISLSNTIVEHIHCDVMIAWSFYGPNCNILCMSVCDPP